ncbi:uncharacterized protein LOC109837082 isoform X2 [Asparagus officinalis]|uniref:uncharacterized protein LOC109837082 isoform X2 n=1 Tax=Asparagus officinalis TaxID=4686 RepID=UPI00098DECC4|nr:uncharacterized protein LOC109837082 isoform X2 [Asparagus officinalis]
MKGLIDALQLVVPQVELRFCARHMHVNFKQKWSGKSFKDVMWKACRAYIKFVFDEAMKEIKDMDESAFNYLMAVDPSHWSRHAFREATKLDCLLNNMCESFNKIILQAKDIPILTTKYIRRLLMKRFLVKQESISQFEGRLVP